MHGRNGRVIVYDRVIAACRLNGREPMLGDGPDREARMAALVQDTPLTRFGCPEEVTAIAVMLASDEVAYMTGAELNLDGGLLAGPSRHPTRIISRTV